MNESLKTIIPYIDERGKQPVIEWLETLDKMTRARINARFAKVEKGNYGTFEPVGDGVKELKFYFGSGYRIYFGEDGDNLVILLMGGDKSTQSVDIEKAKYYWKDYRIRKIGV